MSSVRVPFLFNFKKVIARLHPIGPTATQYSRVHHLNKKFLASSGSSSVIMLVVAAVVVVVVLLVSTLSTQLLKNMEKWTPIKKSRTNTSERDLFHVRLVMATVDAHVSTISGAQAHSLSLRMTAWSHQVVQQYPHSSRTLPQIFRCCSNCFPHLSGSHWTIESNARQKGVAPQVESHLKKNLT